MNSEILYSMTKTAFGPALVAFADGLLIRLSFIEEKNLNREIKAIKKLWPKSLLHKMPEAAAAKQLKKLMNGKAPDKALLVLHGTEFQKKVWKALMAIPAGKTATYQEVANKIGKPKAVRAVGTACGANPIGYIVPCHRVLPKSGGIGSFGWSGPDLKRKMLAFEGVVIK